MKQLLKIVDATFREVVTICKHSLHLPRSRTSTDPSLPLPSAEATGISEGLKYRSRANRGVTKGVSLRLI